MGLGSFTFRKAKRNDAKIISMREKARERESTAIYLIHKNADENKKGGLSDHSIPKIFDIRFS